MSKVKYKIINWGIVIDALIICITMAVIVVLNSMLWILMPIVILFLVFLMFVSIVKIDESYIAVKYPFRPIKREFIIQWTQIETFVFHIMSSKASSEYMLFCLRDGIHIKVLLDVNKITKEMLLFIQSKNIKIEVKGTENNSIEDLR